MGKQIDVVSTLHRPIPRMQILGRLVIHHVTRFHQYLMQSIGMIKHFDRPRFDHVTLRNIDNQTHRMRRRTIDVGQQPRSVFVLSQSVHDGLFDFDTGPFGDHIRQPDLPQFLEMPWNLDETHVGFPPIDEHSLPTPFFPNLVVTIVIKEGSHTGKDVGRQLALMKAECAKRPLDLVVTVPFHFESIFDFSIERMRFDVIGRR
mmetsp:Transcript_27632/g.42546  ORF Transcript_27632/g.42546 Transcript_27632/m.42546 type:complete len:203 (-) Transcript_27632:539-1147(-)